MSEEFSTWAPILISLFGFAISLFTLYLTQFKPAKIAAVIGPEIQIYHADSPSISTGIYMSIAFVNSSSSMGVIERCDLEVTRTDIANEKYYLHLREFVKQVDNKWIYDSEGQALAIPGKSSVSKVGWFMWYSESTPRLKFYTGNYKLRVSIKISNKQDVIVLEKELFISRDSENALENRITSNSLTSLRIFLGGQFDRNRFIN